MDEFVNPQLKSIISEAIATKLPEYASSFLQNDEAHLINIQKIDQLDWYIGVYKKRSSTLSALQDLKLKFFGLFILYAILVALLLHQALQHLVLRRLHSLVYAVSSFGQGKLDTQFPEENKDEIGTLNGSFKDMSVEIRKLIDGLNQRITEKEIAEKGISFNKYSINLGSLYERDIKRGFNSKDEMLGFVVGYNEAQRKNN